MVKKEYNTNFGRAASSMLSARSSTQTNLAASTGKSLSYVNQTMTGAKRPSAQWADLIADAMGLDDEERTKLHIAAAKDHGFNLP